MFDERSNSCLLSASYFFQAEIKSENSDPFKPDYLDVWPGNKYHFRVVWNDKFYECTTDKRAAKMIKEGIPPASEPSIHHPLGMTQHTGIVIGANIGMLA